MVFVEDNKLTRRSFLKNSGKLAPFSLPLAVPDSGLEFSKADRSFSVNERVLRGANVVYKLDPFYPPEDQFSYEDIRRMSGEWDFNFARIGLQWAGLEPERGSIDEEYLSRVEGLLNGFDREGIDVVVEMHQDLFSHEMSGDGAPDWAVKVDENLLQGYNHENRRTSFWQENYLKRPVSEAFDEFWNNTEGVLSDFIETWGRLSNRFSNKENLIGYEIINEPVPSLYNADINDLTYFEEETLPKFYNETVKEIRSHDRDTAIWIQPSAATFNLGIPTDLQGIEDPENNLVFSYHSYAPILGDSKHKTIMKNAERACQSLDMPGVLTEFSGGMKKDTMRDILDYAENLGGWSYWQWNEHSEGWSSEAEKPTGSYGLKHGRGRRLHRILNQK